MEGINCILSCYSPFLDQFMCNLFANSVTVTIKEMQSEIILQNTLETFVPKCLDGIGYGNILVDGRQ